MLVGEASDLLEEGDVLGGAEIHALPRATGSEEHAPDEVALGRALHDLPLTEEGYDIIETPLPCLFTVVKEINTPRIPSLRGMMRAKSAKIKNWTAQEIEADPKLIGLEGSPTRVVKIFTPPARKGGEMLSGDTGDVAKELVELLKDIVI